MILDVKIPEISEKTNELLYAENLPESAKVKLAETHQISTKELTKELAKDLESDNELSVDTESINEGADHDNELRKSTDTRTTVLKKVSKNILQKGNSDITSGVKKNILNKILLSQMELIDQLTKIITRDKKAKGEKHDNKSWKALKKDFEYQYRRISLNKPSDQEQFEADLRWMAAQGKGEDLINILKVKKNPPFSSESILELLTTAESNICNRERLRGTIFGKYRVFASKEEQLKKICPAILLELEYQAFSIVLATEETSRELKDFYPIEQLYQFNDPVELIEECKKSDKSQPKIMQHYLVVKFDIPIPRNWKELIRNTQAEVIESIGRSEAVVYADNQETVNRIQNIPQVKEVTQYEPTIDVRTEYLKKQSEQPVTKSELEKENLQAATNPRKSRNRNTLVPGILIASFFTPDARKKAAHDLENQGIRIASQPGTTTLVLDVTTLANPVESLEIIGKQQGLSFLEEKIIATLSNNVARKLIGQKVIPSNPIPNDASLGLTGKGEIVAVADTGLDTGKMETLHLDLRDQVLEIQSLPATAFPQGYLQDSGEEDGADKYSGHGTHVTGSVLGNGKQAKELGESSTPKGMAPEAKLIFQAIEKTLQWTSEAIDNYEEVGLEPPTVADLYGIPEDLEDLFQPAYDQGARIHSNSWNLGDPCLYKGNCQQLDKFVWDHKDFLVIVSAGNDGKHTSDDIPAIDPKSLTPPGVAKNCLTVGASENNRQGQFPDTYGQKYPDSFPDPPFNEDNMVDEIEDIAAFSGRGPCQDGRIKPDLVAPGTFVLSTRSSKITDQQIAENNLTESCDSPANNHYMYMSGTSMATPLVAGCAALVRQYLREKEEIENPTAAVVKATLIHSAQYMNYRYAHPSSAPWADNEQGWGRVDLCSVLNPEDPTKVIFIDQSEGLDTGDEHQYKIKVTDDSVMLRVTLVYTDPPANRRKPEYIFKNLVNNLNLTVNPPTPKFRRYYLGNDFKNTGEIDNCNNVEGCIIKPEQVQTGTWTIKVAASDVIEAPQDYALVISGGIDSKYQQLTFRN